MLEFISPVEFCIIKSKGGSAVNLHESIAEAIRRIMKERNKSLTEFAEELDISKNALYSYLRGDGNPSIGTLEGIAKKLEIEPAALLLGVLDQGDRQKIAMAILETFQNVALLPEERRMRFAELFLEMMKLWAP